MADYYTLHNGAVTATGASSTVVPTPVGTTVAVNILALVVSGTTPSATFEIQWSNDGTNWCVADGSTDSFAAITAVKNVAKNVTVKGGMMRLAWTVSGTSPSFNINATVLEVNADRC